jgi:hypothetical protein
MKSVSDISKLINKASKLEYTVSQAHKLFVNEIPDFKVFSVLWDAAKNKEGIANFSKLGAILFGFMTAQKLTANTESTKATAKS